MFKPDGIIQQSVANGEPVIYVAINYRVGVFGFASADVLRKQKAENIGLRDQHLGLKWVRDNIAAFGGDPKRVTLFGQSFGGISVGLQLVAWGGKQEALFQKGIMTSGAISKDRPYGLARSNTVLVADALLCSKDDGVIDEEVLECLRKAPLADILKANLDVAHKTKPSLGFAAFSPVVDGDIIPDETKTLLEKGQFLKGRSLLFSAPQTSDNII